MRYIGAEKQIGFEIIHSPAGATHIQLRMNFKKNP